VVLSDKGKADASHKKSSQTFVQDRVAPSKRLRGGVHTIDVIPKSLSGKILRKDLRTMAAKEGQTKAKL
jgi:acyl-coenzyme A synthetase/AMP-(fatty) acid ligase